MVVGCSDGAGLEGVATQHRDGNGGLGRAAVAQRAIHCDAPVVGVRGVESMGSAGKESAMYAAKTSTATGSAGA